MSMQGQGESQPGEGAMTLDSLVAMGESDESTLDESGESEVPEGSEELEAEEQPEEAEEGAEEPTATITVDGKEITLKQSEVIALAQKGSDYTNKTMQLAEERKALEPIKAQAEQHRQENEAALAETVNRLQAYTRFMQAQLGEPPSADLIHTHGAEYFLAQKELHESRHGQLQQAIAETSRLSDEQARQRQAWIARESESAERALKDTLPGWNDAMLKDLAEYAGTLGLVPQNTNIAFLQPGFWQLAAKAKAYDALQAKKAEMKPVNQLPKVFKPGNPQPQHLAKRQDAMKRHNANPTLDSLAALT